MKSWENTFPSLQNQNLVQLQSPERWAKVLCLFKKIEKISGGIQVDLAQVFWHIE